jgi:hypothetical protein
VVIADLAQRGILFNDHVELIVQCTAIQEEAIGLSICGDDNRVRRRCARVDSTGNPGNILARQQPRRAVNGVLRPVTNRLLFAAEDGH